MTSRDRAAQVEGAMLSAVDKIRWAINTHLVILENDPALHAEASQLIVKLKGALPALDSFVARATGLRVRASRELKTEGGAR
jgi:hypothetical protein